MVCRSAKTWRHDWSDSGAVFQHPTPVQVGGYRCRLRENPGSHPTAVFLAMALQLAHSGACDRSIQRNDRPQYESEVSGYERPEAVDGSS